MLVATVVPITPMAWRRDVIPVDGLVCSATIVSSSGIIIEAPVDRLQHSRSRESSTPHLQLLARWGGVGT
jgi:hypothetical protein